MGIVKAPIEHADKHAFAGIRLRQIDPLLHAVGMDGTHQFVHVGTCQPGQFHIGKSGQALHQVQVVGIHAEGNDVADAAAEVHGLAEPGSVEMGERLSEKADHAPAVYQRGRVAALQLHGKLAWIGLLLGH